MRGIQQKRCNAILLVEKAPLTRWLFLVCADPVNGITWIVLNQRPWDCWFDAFGTLISPTKCCCPGRLAVFCVFWDWLHKCCDITLKLKLKKEKGKTSCSTRIVILESDPYFGASSPHPPFSCCPVLLSFCAGEQDLGQAAPPEWGGRNQRPSNCDCSCVCAGLLSSLKSCPKILLNLIQMWDFHRFLIFFFFLNYGKKTIKFTRSLCWEVPHSLEFRAFAVLTLGGLAHLHGPVGCPLAPPWTRHADPTALAASFISQTRRAA